MRSTSARRLLRTKDLIDDRYPEPLDLPTLARYAGISRAHFSREFRRAFGETPHQYLRSRRLERAAALLRSTDLPVNDICRVVGLQSATSFTTSFGRTFGVSPATYRVNHTRDVSDAEVPPCAVRRWARPRTQTSATD